MIHIDQPLIEKMILQARSSPRKRKNLNFHVVPTDLLHRMLHGMEPETYVQPHKHEDPDKREAFIILKGRVAAVQYTQNGEVCDYIILDPSEGNYGVEFEPRTWHSLIVLESGSVVYEVKDGPWNPEDDKYFAAWAPKEGDDKCQDFNRRILKETGIV
jgi:cupin fold WbuC family metalloprotein